MKSVYFWIGVLLFVACAVVFINEHGKFYEYFDGTTAATGTTTGATGTTTAATGTTTGATGTTTAATGTTTGATGTTTAATQSVTPPVSNSTDASGNPVSAPSTTTSTTMQILGGTSPQGNLAPGATSSNPTASAPSQQDFRALVDTVANFSFAIQQAGGKNAVVGKLSPSDITYFNTLYSMIASLGTYADPTNYPFSASQTSRKILEFKTATTYLTNKLPNDMPGQTNLQQTTANAVLAAVPPPPGAIGTTQGSGNPVTSGQTNQYGVQSMMGQNPAGTPGGQGQMPLTGQFTLNGNPTSNYIPNTLTSVFAPSKKETDMCDASDLHTLLGQVKDISANLKSLNTSDPTIVARINNLDSLTQDLQDMDTKIQNGSMDPTKIPIKVGDARNFLNQATIVQNSLPNLITMPGSPMTHSPSSGAASAAPRNTLNPANLLQMAQYLQGSISLSFDGSLYAREQMAKRIDNIIMLLRTKQISSADAQHILQALTSMHDETSPSGYDNSTNDVFTSAFQPTGGMPAAAKPGYLPAPDQLAKASYGGDATVRPGSESDSYKKRASAAYSAYATTDTAGGPDYKSMLQNLCTQVSKSGLDMGDIGCTNVQNVSPDYGYKGTYLMVCNRLKDTWGGNYPQMFGCPS